MGDNRSIKTGDVKNANISTGDNTKQSIGGKNESDNSKNDNSKWSWDLTRVLTAVTIIVAIVSASGIWYKYTSGDAETCTHAVMLYDQNTHKVIKNNTTIYFLYQNDKYTFFGDSEGFYKANLACDENERDGKIHVEADGYQVYERNFKLTKNMQEIRLIPE